MSLLIDALNDTIKSLKDFFHSFEECNTKYLLLIKIDCKTIEQYAIYIQNSNESFEILF